MNRKEFMEVASPPCPKCGSPIKTTEVQNKKVGADWQVSGMVMVCSAGHRTPVEPFERKQ